MSLARISTLHGGGISGLGSGNLHRQRIAQVVVGQASADQHGQRVGFLPGRASRAPYADGIFPARLLLLQQLFQHMFLK